MSEHGPDRVRPSTRTVVAGTVLALALGGWWWVSHPPAAAPGGTVPPAPPTSEVRLDAIVPEPGAGGWEFVPGPDDDTATVVAEPRPAYLDAAEVAALIPPVENAALRAGLRLAPGERYLHDGPAPAGNYLLEFACLGDGAVTVAVTLPDYGYTQFRTACDGRIAELELTYRPGYTAIELVPEGRSRLQAAFQLSPS